MYRYICVFINGDRKEFIGDSMDTRHTGHYIVYMNKKYVGCIPHGSLLYMEVEELELENKANPMKDAIVV